MISNQLQQQYINYGIHMSSLHVDTRSCINFGIEDYLTACCVGIPEYEHLYSIWILQKKRVARESDRNRDQYETFSLHDESHSRMIISCIELLLGQERIFALTPTDAWLILMCAYQHDLGMLVDAGEICAFLASYDENSTNSKKNKEFINSCKNKTTPKDIKEAAFFVSDQLTESKRKEFAKSEDIMDWPPTIVSAVSLLLRYRARREHHKRIKERILSDIVEHTYGGLLTITMIELVAHICYSHGLNDESLMNLEDEVKGAGRDYAHPRFIAMLLRLGDLLDMDSNRFNPYIYKYRGKVSQGGLADESLVHEIKHYSTRNINISPYKISAIASFETKSIVKVFSSRITGEESHAEERIYKMINRAMSAINQWFSYIKGSVDYFALNWHNIVPKKFPGSAPMVGKLAIAFDGHSLSATDFNLKYKISNFRASQVLEGVGMYDDLRVFLRELIQNAWDYTKLHVYNECHNSRTYQNESVLLTDYMKRACEYPVELEITVRELKDDKLELQFRVSDKGIGIESERLRHMKNIGDSYKPNYIDMDDAPEWLKPTTAFGIGLQSVFTIVDEFKIKTTSRRDFKHRIILLGAPKFDGEILCAIETDDIKRFGTSVEILVEREIIQILEEWGHLEENDKSKVARKLFIENSEIETASNLGIPLFSLQNWCLNQFGRYIKHTITNDIIPVKCNFTIEEEYEDGTNFIKEVKNVGNFNIKSIYERFDSINFNPRKNQLHFIDKGKLHFIYWDSIQNVFVEGNFISTAEVGDNIIVQSDGNFGITELYFRGMEVEDEEFITKLKYPFLNIKISILCGDADKTLVVNRQKIAVTSQADIANFIQESILGVIEKIFEEHKEFILSNVDSIYTYTLPLYLYMSYLLWVKDGRKHAHLYSNELKDVIKALGKRLYQSSVKLHDAIFQNIKLHPTIFLHTAKAHETPYFDLTFRDITKSSNKNALDDRLVNQFKRTSSFSYYFKEITVAGRFIDSYTIFFKPPEYIKFKEKGTEEDDYKKYIGEQLVALCKNELLDEHERHLAYIFPATAEYKNIVVMKLPFVTKNETILRYGCYLLSPLTDEYILKIYNDWKKDLENNSTDIEKKWDERIKSEVKKIFDKNDDMHKHGNDASEFKIKKYVRRVTNQIISEHEAKDGTLSNIQKKEIDNNYEKFTTLLLESLKYCLLPKVNEEEVDVAEFN